MVLTALRAPGNVERALADLQTLLFRSLGLLEARALPPLVPLAWSEDAPNLDAFGPAPLPPITLAGPGKDRACIIVGLEPVAPLAALMESVRRTAGGRPGTRAPVAEELVLDRPAFLLAHAGNEEAAARGLATLSASSPQPGGLDVPAGTVVRSFFLVAIRMETWQQEHNPRVLWEEIARKKLRKARPES
jgi:hypothetical protein